MRDSAQQITIDNMQLNKDQRKHLVSLAHSRKPIVRVGQKGLTDNVVTELKAALKAHELVKTRLAGQDRDARTTMIEQLCELCQCECIQSIGQSATFFKRNTRKPVIVLP